MKEKSLTRFVLNYMIDNGSITSWEAIKEFGATRLSAIIFNLRRKGFIIDNEWVETKNRYGMNIRFVNYRLNKEKTFNFTSKIENSINTYNY